ncbi:AAA family ATPase [Bariatricus sp. SGI.154]|uniref:AAA family ATPase n=1 Tax=Bariatricus sp. SGI.154 TaxID=3420549 RepID=UPI003D02CE7D
MKKAFPIGVDNFQELITNDYYYIDKTNLIKELLDLKGKANLFTRPRRFGKTLNMSMLRYFLKTQEMLR